MYCLTKQFTYFYCLRYQLGPLFTFYKLGPYKMLHVFVVSFWFNHKQSFMLVDNYSTSRKNIACEISKLKMEGCLLFQINDKIFNLGVCKPKNKIFMTRYLCVISKYIICKKILTGQQLKVIVNMYLLLILVDQYASSFQPCFSL